MWSTANAAGCVAYFHASAESMACRYSPSLTETTVCEQTRRLIRSCEIERGRKLCRARCASAICVRTRARRAHGVPLPSRAVPTARALIEVSDRRNRSQNSSYLMLMSARSAAAACACTSPSRSTISAESDTADATAAAMRRSPSPDLAHRVRLACCGPATGPNSSARRRAAAIWCESMLSPR